MVPLYTCSIRCSWFLLLHVVTRRKRTNLFQYCKWTILLFWCACLTTWTQKLCARRDLWTRLAGASTSGSLVFYAHVFTREEFSRHGSDFISQANRRGFVDTCLSPGDFTQKTNQSFCSDEMWCNRHGFGTPSARYRVVYLYPLTKP